MPCRVIARGAEAVLCLEGREPILVKERIRKGYRIPALDERIRSGRTRREAKLLSRAAGSGVLVPRVVGLGISEIRMEYIKGRTVKDSFNSITERQRADVCGKIGEMAAMLHGNGMVHGDLTTSNMILKDGKLYLIDFGLGKFSKKIEDQAVDLFLLYEALKAAHYKYLNKSWQKILKIYRQNYSNSEDVLRRFEKISLRRRYK